MKLLCCSVLNTSNIGEPNATSSPVRQTNRTQNKSKNRQHPIRIININFQSLKNKKPELEQIISSTKPDVIIGTETWLSNDIKSSEYFDTTEFAVYRRDRPPNSKDQSYGGVLIAINKSILSEQVVELETACEIVWAEFSLANSRKLIIGSYYRPPSDKGDSIEHLREALGRVNPSSKTTIIIGGDFNLGHQS